VEIRNKIEEFEETSPLYGFLRYRRRNVLIKYMPEDCSRLVQGSLNLLQLYHVATVDGSTWRLTIMV
jgi:hypothetical protein